jgi:hypothetical protein
MMEKRSLLIRSTDLREIVSMDILNRLFEEHFHWPVKRVQPLHGELGGSGRKIIRLSNERASAIGILYGVREENAAFLEFSKHFRKHGLPVPEIYGQDLDHGAYLEEDLGDTTLYQFLSKNRGENIALPVVDAYRKVVAVLPRFQVEAGRDLNYNVCYPIASFDRQSVPRDLNYFKYYFLGSRYSFTVARWKTILALDGILMTADRVFYRDFQSRNILLRWPAFLCGLPGRTPRALRHRFSFFSTPGHLPPELARTCSITSHALGHTGSLEREAFMRHYAYVYARISPSA